MRPRESHDPVEDGQEELARLVTLLAEERPRPRAAFVEELDLHFGDPASAAERPDRAPRPRDRRRAISLGIGAGRFLPVWRRPLVPALAAIAAALLVGLVIVLGSGGGNGGSPGTISELAKTPSSSSSSASSGSAGSAAAAPAAPATSSSGATLAPSTTRKVERSSDLTLGAPASRIGDVAQDVLGVVGRLDGIVDQSSVASAGAGAGAKFVLRFPSARLATALTELSRLPHAHVLARVDDSQDVNQTYVSARRRLANARAERDGLLRALRAAGTEAETLRLRDRLAAVERTIATAERDQRALDRRVDFSRVTLDLQAQDGGAAVPGNDGGGFTPARALHDAGRVLAVTGGVVVIAAAALVPLAVLLLLAWPAARVLRRRRRDHALDGG